MVVIDLEPVLWRIFLFVSKELLYHEIDRMRAELLASVPGGSLVLYEGLFNLGKASLVFTREGEDVAVCSMHVAPIREGLIADTPIDDSERTTANDRLTTFFTALKGFYPAEFKLDRIVWHDAGPKNQNAAGKTLPLDAPKGSKNPQLAEYAVGIAGNSAADTFQPPQCATTVTFKTVTRRQWGRIYLPAGDTSMLNSASTHAGGIGQLTNGATTAIRDASSALLEGLNADNLPLVIWSHVHQHALSVDTVQVDSLVDVIRSRRYDRALYKLSHTLGT